MMYLLYILCVVCIKISYVNYSFKNNTDVFLILLQLKQNKNVAASSLHLIHDKNGLFILRC